MQIDLQILQMATKMPLDARFCKHKFFLSLPLCLDGSIWCLVVFLKGSHKADTERLPFQGPGRQELSPRGLQVLSDFL